MCGVFAIFDHNLKISTSDKIKSLNIFKHRGPDNTNFIELDNMFLGHHRLSIRDLSDNSNQPKFSYNKNFLISYNGELYNTNELFDDLNKHQIQIYNKNSDTEVLVNYISVFGIDRTLNKIKGMFAFICIDLKNNKIFAARDAFGEKPLYFYIKDKNYIFTSDINSIKKLIPDIKTNDRAIDYFVRLSYIPSPFSIYNDVYKVEPGQYIVVDGSEKNYDDLKKISFFNPINFVNDRIKTSKKEIERNLIESIESQLISDVPIGTFLSGGIDSSLITAIASKFNKDITTFTIGFEDDAFDESKYAQIISKELGLKNHTMIVKPNDLLDTITDISKIYSEPFADSSQIPTFILSKFSSQEIKVALTGDGGDELFGGYNRYIYYKLYKKIISAPMFIKKIVKDLLPFLPIDILHKEKIRNKILNVQDVRSYYYSMTDHIGLNNNLKSSSQRLLPMLFSNLDSSKISDITLLQIMDILHYLPDDILVKTDRASMYNGLETRAPFLNIDLFTAAINLNDNQKIKYFKGGKVILKEILSEYISPNLFKRPKKGFGIPIASWLKDDLKGWANDCIKSNDLNHIIDLEYFRKIFDDHIKNKKDNSNILWNYLMLFDWYEKNN